jgi:hypothetical protein
MTVKPETRRMILLNGLMTWIIPFALSLALYDKHGVLRVDPRMFKSMMVVVRGSVGAVLLARD